MLYSFQPPFCFIVRTLSLLVVAFIIELLYMSPQEAVGQTYSLRVSDMANRSNPSGLEGASVSGNIYVFLSPETGVSQARFFLDDPTMSGAPQHVENLAPYDFAGGAVSAANPFNTAQLGDGAHTITAAVDRTTGGTEVVNATFTVANTGPALVWSASTVSFTGEEGSNPPDQTVDLTTNDGSVANYTVSESAPWLAVSPTPGTTPAMLTLTIDATGLAPGSYTTTVTATASGYASASFTVGLTVTGMGGGTYSLRVSDMANRSNPSGLEGASVSGNIYVFLSPETGVSQARFFLDDPTMSGAPQHVENLAPYDFAGGAVSAANPFNTAQLGDGAHTITAAVDRTTGGTEVVNATFTVANTGPALVFSSDTVLVNVGPGEGTSTQVNLGTNDGSVANYTVSESAPWLAVSPTPGTTPAMLTLTIDATGLTPNTYTATVTATASGYLADSLTVNLSVITASAPDQVHLAWVDDPSTTLTVIWRTVGIAPSVVEYRPLGASVWQSMPGVPRPSGTSGTLHEATLTSLTPSTNYEYRVLGDGSIWSEIFLTRTAPSPGPADFDVIYVADTGLVGRLDGLATGTQQVIDEIANLNPLLILPGGDYAYFNTDKRFGSLDNTIDAWFSQMEPIAVQSPMMPTYGNHEALLGEGYGAWASRFPTPEGFDGRRNYSFDIGDVHFVSIFAVSNHDGLSSGTLAWIEQDIIAAKNAGKRWIIPYFHVSPFSDGTNHPSNLNLRAQLGPLFEQLDVKLVISSHDQAYERTFPLIDVPATNTPTSTSKTCYTIDDGVTWVKVSPGGKLSNISQDFSPFGSDPAPSWTAFRNNTMHNFARLSVTASGDLYLDAYGVVGDGSPPVIFDSFQYTLGNCPPALEFDANSVSITVSEGGSTSDQTVDLTTNDGSVANYTVSESAPWLAVSPTPGTTPAMLTLTIDATGLAPGSYTTTVTATASGYASASFTVGLTVTGMGGGTYSLRVSDMANRSNPSGLEGASVSGNIYVFLSPETGVSQARFFLDDPTMSGAPQHVENLAPYDFAGGAVSAANPFNTAQLGDGAHTITAAVDRTTGGTEVVNATFTVANTGPALVWSASTVSFTGEEGSNPPDQTVDLTTNDGSVANYTVSESAPWLAVSPTPGTTPAMLTLTIDATGLAPGSYTTTVTATASGYASASFTVGLTVTGMGGGTYSLRVSDMANRSNPSGLEGASVSGNIYVFLSPETGVSQARFFLDDPTMSGAPQHVENLAPYDFAGGAVSAANPFNTAQLGDGAHTITAAVDRTTGGTEVVNATFTVANTGPALVWSASTVSFTGEEGSNPPDQTVDLTTNDGSVANYTVSESAPWLAVSPTPGTTPAMLTLTIDATGLTPNTYTATVTATASGYLDDNLTVTLIVGNSEGCSPLPLFGDSH